MEENKNGKASPKDSDVTKGAAEKIENEVKEEISTGRTEIKEISTTENVGTEAKEQSSVENIVQRISSETTPAEMSATAFVNYKSMMTSKGFGSKILPTNFFQSRNSIHTWGADVIDPSIQPYDKNDPNLPDPFHVSLPGYTEKECKYVLHPCEKPPRENWMGPEITIHPPIWYPRWAPDPNFEAQDYGYEVDPNRNYETTRLPYVNAKFEPKSAQENNMYGQNYPYAAYPYGVPLC